MTSSPASAGGTASSGFANADTGDRLAGTAASFPWPLELLQLNDKTFDSKTLAAQFRKLQTFLQPFGGRIPELYNVAKFFGMAYATGAVTLSMSVSGDTRFAHELGRIPKMVVFSLDLNGTGGQIRGAPAGGIGAGGGNQTAWTKTDIFVRATLDSDYAFLVI